MYELLCAVEDNRYPLNSAEGNLQSLALAFAAIQSACDGVELEVAAVNRLLTHNSFAQRRQAIHDRLFVHD
jgi:hypothetical protein